MATEPRRKLVWFYPARELEGPWLGVPGCRPPVWCGGDEYGRRTIVFQLPGVGAVVIALPFQSTTSEGGPK
jgi:hypothetical protein